MVGVGGLPGPNETLGPPLVFLLTYLSNRVVSRSAAQFEQYIHPRRHLSEYVNIVYRAMLSRETIELIILGFIYAM